MTQVKVDMYIIVNQKNFPADKIMYLRQQLEMASDNKFPLLLAVEQKDPTFMLLISMLLGSLGVDRFLLGDTGMGILKLLTCGCCGILTIIDWFNVSKRTKEYNLNNVMRVL